VKAKPEEKKGETSKEAVKSPKKADDLSQSRLDIKEPKDPKGDKKRSLFPKALFGNMTTGFGEEARKERKEKKAQKEQEKVQKKEKKDKDKDLKKQRDADQKKADKTKPPCQFLIKNFTTVKAIRNIHSLSIFDVNSGYISEIEKLLNYTL
jgi:hypothetical protein